MFRMMNKLKNRKGFTLIELIVVLAVLAIIMAIAVPRFLGVQETAKEDADYSTGGMIAKSAELYVAQSADDKVLGTDLSTSQVKDVIDSLGNVDFQSKKFNAVVVPTDIKITVTSDGAIEVYGDSDKLYPVH